MKVGVPISNNNDLTPHQQYFLLDQANTENLLDQ